MQVDGRLIILKICMRNVLFELKVKIEFHCLKHTHTHARARAHYPRPKMAQAWLANESTVTFVRLCEYGRKTCSAM